MNSPSISEGIDQSRSHVAIFLYRDPKKNHDALVKINKRSHDFFVKHGVLEFEVFTLNSKENVMDFVNLAKTISASEDQEVWFEIQSHRDAKHIQKFVKTMESDTSRDEVYKEFMKLVTPNSIVSFDNFSKLNKIA